jgi:hypothetical protein
LLNFYTDYGKKIVGKINQSTFRKIVLMAIILTRLPTFYPLELILKLLGGEETSKTFDNNEKYDTRENESSSESSMPTASWV